VRNPSTLNLLTLASALLLSACALLPDSPPPDPDLPRTLRGGTALLPSGRDFGEFAWWKRFADPVLDGLIDRALAANNQIRTAFATVQQAEAQLRAARLAWLPTLATTGGGVAARGFGTTITPRGAAGPGGVAAISDPLSDLGTLTAGYGGLVPSYSLNIFANLNQTRLAEAALEVRRAAHVAVRLAVIGQVAGGYFNLLAARQQLTLQSQLIEHLESLHALETTRFRSGSNSALPQEQLATRLGDTRASLPGIRDSIARTENALRLLAGQNPGPVETPMGIEARPLDFQTDGSVPPSLPSAVLLHRPDIQMAAHNLKLAEAQVGLANSAFFPKISLTGLAGGVSAALSNLLSANTGLWAATAAASLPLLNARKLEEVGAASSGYQSAWYDYLQTVKAALAEVDDRLTSLQQSAARLAYQQAALTTARRAYRIVQARHQAGAVDRRTPLQAQLDLDNAEIALNAAKLQHLTDLVALYQSLAGGYAVKPRP
jgi:multidrug efflux system outer membrane protein